MALQQTHVLLVGVITASSLTVSKVVSTGTSSSSSGLISIHYVFEYVLNLCYSQAALAHQRAAAIARRTQQEAEDNALAQVGSYIFEFVVDHVYAARNKRLRTTHWHRWAPALSTSYYIVKNDQCEMLFMQQEPESIALPVN